MGFCSRRNIFLSVCFLQTLSVIERQVFDFLGYLWIPILLNFFEIIFIILGFFGAYQYRPKYIISYVLWHCLWLGWNVFLICLYLDIGTLDHKTNKVLKLDPNSESWWSNQGPGCKKILPLTSDPWTAKVENCLLDYIYVEVFHSGLQCILALLGAVIGICLSRAFLEEDDTFNYEDAKGPEHLFLHPMYVSSSDNLNHHPLINTHINVKSRYVKNKVPGDAVRYIQRSSSFDVLNAPLKKNTKRPKSMCVQSYFDDDDLNY